MKTSVSLREVLHEHKDKYGVSLHQHLVSIVEMMVKDKSNKEFADKFEKISAFVKKNRLNYATPKMDYTVNKIIDVRTELTEWEDEVLEMLGVIVNTFSLVS